jgi:hypothetical protein
MPYQPLVTHYCKKFHEAALGGRRKKLDSGGVAQYHTRHQRHPCNRAHLRH